MSGSEITRLLKELESPSVAARTQALDRLMPLVYSRLKTLARQNRYRWRGQPSQGTTSLVHEAYAKLAEGQRSFESRGQFFGVASKAMRSILIDNARWHRREKRGGGLQRVPLDEVELVSAERSEELLALDEALDGLEDETPELARVVECRVFAGLTNDETAEALEVSVATVKRRFSLAKAMLYQSLRRPPEASGVES